MQTRNVIAVNIKHFLQHRFGRQFSFVRARLSPEGLYGLYLTIGILVLVGAAWLFGGVSEDVITGDPLVQVDAYISEWLRSHPTPRFATGMLFATALASTNAVGILLSPMIASAAMSLSSVSVIGNALRLRKAAV